MPEGRRARVLRPGEVYLGFSYDTWREHLGGAMEVPPTRVFPPQPPAEARQHDQQPIAISAVLDKGFQLIRGGSLPLLVLALACEIPPLLLGLSLGGEVSRGAEWLWFLPFFAWMGLVQAAMILGFSQAYHGSTPDLPGVAQTVARRAGAIVAATFLSWLLVMLGLMVLIIPGIILMCRYFAATAVVVLEGRGPWQSLGRSGRLGQGYGWSIFLTFGILQVLSYLMDFGLRGLQASGGTLARIGDVVEFAAGVFLLLLSSAVVVAFYYALRVGKEAYDVELLAQAAARAAAA